MSKGKLERRRNNATSKAPQIAREASCADQAAKREEMSAEQKSRNSSGKAGRWKELFAGLVPIVGLVTTVLSLFPHVAVSDPVQMDPTDIFSYQITLTNNGVLPIFGAKWAFAPSFVKVSPALAGTENNGNSRTGVTLLLPNKAEFVITPELMNSVTKPGSERHAAFIVNPGSEIRVDGPANGEFHIRPANNSIGIFAPGDQFTFTTEGLMVAPLGATYDTADFAIAITYIPVFPPIPMQTCSHFYIYKDRQANPHWFRATNQCDRIPWLHHWFDKPNR